MPLYNVIGMMSGTSLDGLDLAYCKLRLENGEWNYSIQKAETVPYSVHWCQRLKSAPELTKDELQKLDISYGKYLGQQCASFINKNKIQADLIASHGHTVYHEPKKGLTLQIGDGKEILKICKITTTYDFRSLDVALGGQGAPLVPIGDKYLFKEYDYCLNLGGFANISYDINHQRIAYDICPLNIVINQWSQRVGHVYDKDGEIAKSGKICKVLLNKLNLLEYYQKEWPKSLGNEWVIEKIQPIMEASPLSIEDKLRTYYEHCTEQIIRNLTKGKERKILITGGGAFNKFLISNLASKTDLEIYIPEKRIIEFKEALIFALLGVLRLRNEFNCLSSVTGARKDSSGGILITQKQRE